MWKVDPAGQKSIAVSNVHTHELYLDAGGYLYGEHLWYEGDHTKKWGHRVWRRGPDGRVSDVIPATKRVTPNGAISIVYTMPTGWSPTGVAAVGGRLHILEYS